MKDPEVVLSEYLAERGLAMGDEHRSVCAAVFGVHQHFTRDWLCSRMSGVPGAHVERILGQLVGAGLVREVPFRGSRVFYEHTYGHPHHDHLVCVACGKIVEFSRPEIEAGQEAVARENGFEPLRHTLRIEGLCTACRARDETTDLSPVPDPPRVPHMPLSLASPGEPLVVRTIRGGGNLQRRLASMGITVGGTVEVLQSHFAGPIIVQVRGSRIAVGHGISHRIYVSPVTEGPNGGVGDAEDVGRTQTRRGGNRHQGHRQRRGQTQDPRHGRGKRRDGEGGEGRPTRRSD